jgi:hypothetical protein
LKGEEYEAEATAPQRSIDDYLRLSFIGLAIVAILLGIIGLIRGENLRLNIAGAALGVLAITFQVALVMFFAFLFMTLLVAVIDKLDFDFF